MFRNYLIIALRNIARHKLYSFINIAGLAVGLASLILIVLFVRDELSYDKWIPGSDKLYRVEVTYLSPGRSDIITAQISMPLPVAMRDQIPEVRSATRLMRQGMTMTAGDRQFLEKIAVVDPNFLQVVQLPLVVGDPRTVLSQRDTIVISQRTARKYFGDADPIGKTLATGRGRCNQDPACANTMVALKVVGVMRDLPHNTQIDVDILMPIDSLADRSDPLQTKSWFDNNGYYGYVTLAPGTDPAQVLAKLKLILDRSIDPFTFSNVKVLGSKIMQPRLVRFVDAHLTTDRYGAMRPPGSWTTLYGMGIIGVLILLVACFNFMNLATARATMRAREISLRKCVGATRRQLITQFLGESVLIALLALLLALALAEVLLPSYGSFLQVPLSLHYLADWPLLAATLGIAILSGLVSGFYPALVLSGFRPAAVLRANTSGNPGSGTLRTTLVVLQFAVSIGLGIAATVVFRQIDFARHLDLGFRRDNIVITGTGGRLSPEGVESFVRTLAKGPGIVGVARSSFIAFSGDNSSLTTQKPGDPQILTPTSFAVTPDYFNLYGIKILAGRVLSDHRSDDEFYSIADGGDYVTRNDGHNIMVNAALARALGYAPANIIGKTVLIEKSHMRVVGVAADQLVDGARSPVVQTIYFYRPKSAQSLSIRIQAGRTQEAMAYIERVSRSFVHNTVLTRTFLDDSFEKLYQADRKQGQMFAIFVAIAIFIACLGLFGLAAFTAGRRTKEIGIRKVFGARVQDVVVLLLWQFSIPVLIANAIAWPVAWYYLQDWLQGFAYRITLSPVYFVGAGATAMVIAWATVFVHARRVAGANPIHALRYE
ncbi:MAG TPA: ABC transporter permease [Rhizomicrobium sp.]|nr:ABC transporter permease [Rhizomicrobium sp.]